MIGAGEVIAAGLGSAVGAVRSVRRGLTESRIIRTEGTIHLIGRDVEKGGLTTVRDRFPVMRQRGATALGEVFAKGVEKAESADHIRQNECLGAIDRTINMRLRGEVHHGIDLMLAQQAADQLFVADVALHKDMAGISIEVRNA